MRANPRSLALILVSLTVGCARKPPADPGAVKPSAEQELASEINKAITESWARHATIPAQSGGEYVGKLDRVEAYLAGKGKSPRFFTLLEAKQEDDHFRKIISDWKAKTGKDLRAEIDAVKAKGRGLTEADLRKHLGEFQDIEQKLVIEERARFLHEKAEPLLERYRKTHPDVVAKFEDLLNKPPHALPKAK